MKAESNEEGGGEWDNDHDAFIKGMERRAAVFGEEAILNMLDFTGPVATIKFLKFWMTQIKADMKEEGP